ncbi:DUF418 domain-containing protein [Nocardioides speluncae]|uniref:DUF418 domain-containing protein n=1 Tax=Nocardioides speluncae TaxID=2670337 RepID=UPI000D69A3CC|nr:DUF418 domain-containing protein [Nocardioides speluncae]
MTSAAHAPPVTGPTAVTARALGPDVARGGLLLFIALANAHTFLHWPGTTTVRAMPVTGAFVDGLVAVLLTVIVDGRSYTMFAALFGYGLVQITRRQERAGAAWDTTKKLLRKRGRWMFVIGFLHATLLFYADIITAYALLAIVLVSSVRARSRRLFWYAGIWMLLGSVVYALLSWPAPSDQLLAAVSEDNPLLAAVYRAGGILLAAPFAATTAAGAFMLGIWAARHRLLEDPGPHRDALTRFAVIGITVSVLGGLPLGLVIADVIPHDNAGLAVGLGYLHALTGYAGGPAYAVAIALWASRRQDAPGPVGHALQAVGQRSMTCYVLQSVVWLVAFAPYLLDLGTELRIWQCSLLALATWLATVGIAEWMRRRDIRGPLEVLLRRLTYR